MASNSTDRFLVTGGLGCIGAWVAHELLAEGACVQICDVGGSRHRIEQLVAPDAEGLSSSALDITDSAAVARCFDIFRPTHVFHLAALQVPFCKADPVLGASVNVVGTVVLMEEMAERLPPLLLETFLGVKRWELATAAEDADLEATCARYASAY